MTDQVTQGFVDALTFEAAAIDAAVSEPSRPSPALLGKKNPAKRPAPVPTADVDKFLNEAKRLVVDNYNAHHDKGRTPPLTADLCYIVWFAKTVDNWKAIIGSHVLHGLLYEVSYVGSRSKAYIGVYRKINNVTISY